MAQMPSDRKRAAPTSTRGVPPYPARPSGATPTARLPETWTSTFSPLGSRLNALRQTPAQLRTTITRNGRTYKEIDNGRANVLVPTLDPGTSPAELAARQAAIKRALYMANNPLAGLAYGLATLTGATPRTRDSALAMGGIADAVIGSSVPRTSRVRPPTPAKQGRVAAPTRQRANIRPSELNADKQAGRVEATAIASMVGTGTAPQQKIRPPGFEGGAAGHSRGHLYPSLLGGSGKDPRNLVTLSQNPTNHPHMSGFDGEIARRVRSGEVIEYSSTPIYNPGVGPPGTILMTATGSRGTRMARIVRNPAGWAR